MEIFRDILRNKTDVVDEAAERFIIAISDASNNDYDYPEPDNVTEDNYLASLLIPLMIGSKGSDASELSAIHLYTTQKQVFRNESEFSQLQSKVMLVEMLHYDHYQEMILKLGGEITELYSNESVTQIGKNVIEAIGKSINNEITTIQNLEYIINIINAYREKNAENNIVTNNCSIVLKMLNKIMEDEKVHLSLYESLFKKYINEEAKDKKVQTNGILKVKID